MSNAPWGPPQPPGPGPGLPPARSGTASLIVVLCVGLSIVLVCTVGLVRWLGQSADRGATSSGATRSSQPTTTSTPTQSATAAPPAQQPTSSSSARPAPSRSASTPAQSRTPDLSLKKNTVYSIDLSGRGLCQAKIRRPKPPLKNSALAPYLRTVVTCLVNAFRAPLAAKGFALTTPKIKTFKKSVKTPCGTLGSRTNPAFYCAGTIYWPVTSDDAREAYTFARLGYVGLLAHEFGHHLQATTGILYAYGSRYQA